MLILFMNKFKSPKQGTRKRQGVGAALLVNEVTALLMKVWCCERWKMWDGRRNPLSPLGRSHVYTEKPIIPSLPLCLPCSSSSLSTVNSGSRSLVHAISFDWNILTSLCGYLLVCSGLHPAAPSSQRARFLSCAVPTSHCLVMFYTTPSQLDTFLFILFHALPAPGPLECRILHVGTRFVVFSLCPLWTQTLIWHSWGANE